ncbi:MAG: EamA family transporter [Gemmatimonadales bacterium]
MAAFTSGTGATPAKTFWAFAAIYLIWGSTYLAIRFAVHSMPPFFLGAVRFLLAGAALFLWARWQGERSPGGRTWVAAAGLGTLFFVLGNGLVVWAEVRMPSARTALLASTSPIWTALLEGGLAGGRLPRPRVAVGIALGFAGLMILASPTHEVADTVPLSGLLALLGASAAWALGSVISHRRHLDASPAMATSMKMLGGGAQLALVSLVAGEWGTVGAAEVSGLAWAALAYLVIFGSVIGFTAFTYLLRTTSPQAVATSAYVNPVVALALGWGLGGEQVTGRMLLGATVVLSSVLLVRWVERPAQVEAGDVAVVETGEWEAIGGHSPERAPRDDAPTG